VLADEGRIGLLYPRFFTLTGNASNEPTARGIGAVLAGELNREAVDGVILVAT
jgi:hypothetical protein